MVFPLGDENSDRTITPVVNYVLIALNIFVFVIPQGMGVNDKFTYAFSCVPAEIRTGEDVVTADRKIREPIRGEEMTLPGLQPTPIPVYLTLLTSMFMHGGWAHLLGNMWFLWIFGDNIEDAVGHLRYVTFYLVCGILAGLTHVASTFMFDGNPLIPSLGASGAISGVLGGYIVLHPHRRVTAIIFRFITDVPAVVVIGMWFLFQLISGLGALGAGSQAGGVAYGAHIGGFVAGVVLIKIFTLNRSAGRMPPVERW